MKKTLFIITLFISCIGANASILKDNPEDGVKEEKHVFYGTYAVQSSVNPCGGETIRECGTITTVYNDYGKSLGNAVISSKVEITKTVCDANGNVILTATDLKNGDLKTVMKETEREMEAAGGVRVE